MTTQDFDFVRRYVREQAAIVLEPGKEYLVESRLLALARKENIPTIEELVQRMRAGPINGYHRKVVDAMTTNETSFFRDIHPFDALRLSIIPELMARRRAERSINIWCGAASTGQEPYSVLMLMAESFPDLLTWDVTFVATDLCTDVLVRAREGRFSQLEVNRGLPARLLVKYFVREGAEWRIKEEFRKRIEFRELNLVRPWPALPALDIVFLRNVLIYFDIDSKKSVLSRIRDLLRPGGYLLLGSAETTFNIDDGFSRTVVGNTSCYRTQPA